MADTTRHNANNGIYIITHCWKRYDEQGTGWYRIFGQGGFWNVLLDDKRLGSKAENPHHIGKIIGQVRLRPSQNPRNFGKNVAVIEAFEQLEPFAAEQKE